MKKEVVVYTCDNCKTKKDGVDSVFNGALPEGWVEIKWRTNTNAVQQELCTDCFVAVGNALGERNKP